MAGTGTTGVASVYSTYASKPSYAARDAGLKDQFMRLLIAELKYQDPLSPIQDREFIAQLAQFSTMESIEKLNASFGVLAGVQKAMAAAALVGRRVVVNDGGTMKEIVVESARLVGEGSVVGGGREWALDQVIEVKDVLPKDRDLGHASGVDAQTLNAGSDDVQVQGSPSEEGSEVE